MSFLCVAILPSQARLRIVVEVMDLCPPHVLELWFWVSMGMLLVKYFRSQNPSILCQLNVMEIMRLTKISLTWPPLLLWILLDIEQ